jgi:L-fuculose-phosphate aldolase/L-ribulose-5-phosphate 4-epimerase
MLLEFLRSQVVETARKLPKHNLVVLAGGNVSARDKDTGAVAITPSGVDYEVMRPDDVIVISATGEQIDGRLRPSVDLSTHLKIYKARQDIFAVMHTHSTYATTLSILGLRLPDLTSTLAYSNGPGGVDVAPYAHVYDPKFRENVVKALGDRHAVLLENHGVISCGATLKKCLQVALIVEQVAQMYLVARTIGEPKVLPAQYAREIYEHYSAKYGQKVVPGAIPSASE